VVVRFSRFGASSLDIELMAWFQTSDWGEFQLIRQEVLLQFMDVIEEARTSIAFPTHTVHIAATNDTGTNRLSNGRESDGNLPRSRPHASVDPIA
jgi:MscS family membrane protein